MSWSYNSSSETNTALIACNDVAIKVVHESTCTHTQAPTRFKNTDKRIRKELVRAIDPNIHGE